MFKVSCPICGQVMEGESLAEWPAFPFCSVRCKTIDLGRWLDESYALPSEEGEDSSPQDEPERS